MAYLARWRMFRGSRCCAKPSFHSNHRRKVGYGSAAAFSLAFTRSHGVSPGAYRYGNSHAIPR